MNKAMALNQALNLAAKGLLCLVIIAGGALLALEIDKHYQAPDWSGVHNPLDCPPDYVQDGGFGCIAENPAQMVMDTIHNAIILWPIGLLLITGAAVWTVLDKKRPGEGE